MKKQLHNYSKLIALIVAMVGLVFAIFGAINIAISFALLCGVFMLLAAITSEKQVGGGVNNGIPH